MGEVGQIGCMMRLNSRTGSGQLGPPLRLESHRNAASKATLTSITIRPAHAGDHRALADLAALDGAELPSSPMLVAERDGELRAALSLSDGSVIADPFFPTVHLAQLLRAHAAATARSPRRRRRSYRLRYA
jgi:hypothetical protein